MAEGIVFRRLQLGGWRQFASINIDFHDRLTVLTGANGSGKSTLLNVLARHVGLDKPYLSVPTRNEQGLITYLSGKLKWSSLWEAIAGPWKWKPANQVGEIHYSDDGVSYRRILVTDGVRRQRFERAI